MGYQYVREPLRFEEADRLCQACETVQEKLIVWTLLDTGLRVSELCGLTTEQILWQQKAIRVSGKGGPYEGTRQNHAQIQGSTWIWEIIVR
ncbi:tyrosine-type recombinase/integrase [Candidatus Cardinium hertigii]|uniref:tyrosine-type recombinase/integrase n=1 Tax=Candidatus Cardinium hertigii TaxID=247481 RepID=UPI003D7F0948